MTLKIGPAKIKGSAVAPPSKSVAHRAIITAALAGKGTVKGIIPSDDMLATLEAVKILGTEYTITDDRVDISVTRSGKRHQEINCIESGTTLRLLLPIVAARGIDCTFTGQGRLPQRPMDIYAECLPKHGVYVSDSTLPITISGKLQSGEYNIPGDVSSQFISGLLLALPLLDGDSTINLTTPLQSRPYVDLTLQTMENAGVFIKKLENGWHISGNQEYKPNDTQVEGDWSQAAFLLAMGALAGEVTVNGVKSDSLQGDMQIVDILKDMGAVIRQEKNSITCSMPSQGLKGIRIDSKHIPDLVPIVCVLAAFAQGSSTISGAGRLKYKESNRLEAMLSRLQEIGVPMMGTENGTLMISGNKSVYGNVDLSGADDHRVIMSLAVAALRCQNPITLYGSSAVAKSWPEFFDVYKSCGGDVSVIGFG